jgi:MFS family permease
MLASSDRLLRAQFVTNQLTEFTELRLGKARRIVHYCFIFNGFSIGIYIARIPDIRDYFSLSNAQLGLILFTSSIGILFSMKPAGALSARFGSARVVLHATWLYGLSTIFVGFLFSVTWFIVTMLFSSFLVAVHDISMNSHAAAIEKISKKSIMNSFHARFSMGGLFGAGLGGLFSQLDVSYLSQNILIAIISVCSLPFLIKYLLPAEVDIQTKIKTKEKSERERPHIFWYLGLLGFGASVCEGAAADWGSILLRDTWQTAPFISTIPFIAFSAAMVIGRLNGDRITDRFSRELVVKFGGYISGFGLTLGLIIGRPIGITLGWIFLGIGMSVVIPTIFSAAGEIANSRFVGHIAPSQAVAIAGGISYAGFMIGPPLLGLIADYTSLRWALLIPAAVAFAMGFSARLVRSN